jgi:hypothetical protein
LDDAVDRFDGSLGDLALEVTSDTVPILSESFSEFAKRTQSTANEIGCTDELLSNFKLPMLGH